ncbi:helix-turn-helix domain-containing protein [Streptomyces capparidis]
MRTDDERLLLASACEELLTRVPRLTDELMAQLRRHSAEYDLAVPHDEHWEQIGEAMRYGIQAITAGRSVPRRDLEYAERLGRRRAEQGLSLDLLLHAYRRAGHLVWDALLEVVTEKDPNALRLLVHTAAQMWAAVDIQAETVASAYRVAEQAMRRRSDERIQALLDALLEGDPPPGLAARAAAGLDLPEQGRYAVVVLRGSGVHTSFHRVPSIGVMRLVWRMGTEYEVGVAELGDANLADLAAELDRRHAGPGGISPVVGGLEELGRARRLAELAMRTCGPEGGGVVRLDQRLPTALVISQPELSAQLVAAVFGPLLHLDPTDRALLLETLDAWLECGGSAGRAATRLYCHRNTVFNRLRRLEQLTSRSLSHPRDMIEMTLALDAFRLVTTR